jgi:hypothetical protein
MMVFFSECAHNLIHLKKNPNRDSQKLNKKFSNFWIEYLDLANIQLTCASFQTIYFAFPIQNLSFNHMRYI